MIDTDPEDIDLDVETLLTCVIYATCVGCVLGLICLVLQHV